MNGIYAILGVYFFLVAINFILYANVYKSILSRNKEVLEQLKNKSGKFSKDEIIAFEKKINQKSTLFIVLFFPFFGIVLVNKRVRLFIKMIEKRNNKPQRLQNRKKK